MTIESFFIGTRRSDKRYGPQSKDMQVSEFISLISPKNAPHKVVLPDFTGWQFGLMHKSGTSFIN